MCILSPVQCSSTASSFEKETPIFIEVINMTLEGKAAVVIGGSGGIGVEMCKHLLTSGLSKLAILDINEPASDIIASIKVCNAASEVIAAKCDITNKSNLEDVIRKQVLGRFGYFDLLVNSAGTVDERNPERLIAINLIGVINSSLMAMSLMSKEQSGGKGGMIVNISSIAGLEPTPFLSVYSASKFGVTGFTRSLSGKLFYSRTGVKCITICPGITDSTLLSKFFEGEDLLFPWMSTIGPEVKKCPSQSASAVGECLVKAVLDGENGAVWVVNDGTAYKLEISANKFIPCIE